MLNEITKITYLQGGLEKGKIGGREMMWEVFIVIQLRSVENLDWEGIMNNIEREIMTYISNNEITALADRLSVMNEQLERFRVSVVLLSWRIEWW